MTRNPVAKHANTFNHAYVIPNKQKDINASIEVCDCCDGTGLLSIVDRASQSKLRMICDECKGTGYL